jgi:hypothetical protein
VTAKGGMTRQYRRSRDGRFIREKSAEPEVEFTRMPFVHDFSVYFRSLLLFLFPFMKNSLSLISPTWALLNSTSSFLQSFWRKRNLWTYWSSPPYDIDGLVLVLIANPCCSCSQ